MRGDHSGNARPLDTRRPQGAGAVIGGGALAGLIAGAAMLAAAMGAAAGMGAGATLPVRGIAASLNGVTALIGGGGGAIAAGWCLQLANGAVLGLIYTGIGWNIRRWRAALTWGVVYGIGVWALMTFVLLPTGDPVMAAYVGLMAGTWFWLHVLFGAVLSVSAPIRRGLAGSAPSSDVRWQLPKAS